MPERVYAVTRSLWLWAVIIVGAVLWGWWSTRSLKEELDKEYKKTLKKLGIDDESSQK